MKPIYTDLPRCPVRSITRKNCFALLSGISHLKVNLLPCSGRSNIYSRNLCSFALFPSVLPLNVAVPVLCETVTSLPGYSFFQAYKAVITPDDNMIYQFNVKKFAR